MQKKVMAISIDVFIDQSDEHTLKLEENFYWYLHPMFEQINAHTGRYIDLHGKCIFPVESLSVLQKYIFEKKHTIRQLKPSALVFISGEIIVKTKNGRTIRKDNIVEVDKINLLNFLTQINNLIDIARQNSCELHFIGD